MYHQSFFRLTAAHPDPGKPSLLHALSPEEFHRYNAEAELLVDALLIAIQAYGTTHPALSRMAVYMAADIVQYSVERQIRDEDAEA